MGFTSELKKILRTRFISGLLVVVPVILTYVLLKALIESIDGMLSPVVKRLLGHQYDFPFIGIIVTLAIILLTGIFTANVIGHRFVRLWEKQILKLPVINFIYGSIKQLIQALTIPANKSFKSVVMVEYPRRGIYALGFLVNEMNHVQDNHPGKLLSIFIPSTPTPISGYIILLPEKDVEYLDMTIEEGIKFFVSASIISPLNLAARNKAEAKNIINSDKEI
jgi:uncharacterized membrane protein